MIVIEIPRNFRYSTALRTVNRKLNSIECRSEVRKGYYLGFTFVGIEAQKDKVKFFYSANEKRLES